MSFLRCELRQSNPAANPVKSLVEPGLRRHSGSLWDLSLALSATPLTTVLRHSALYSQQISDLRIYLRIADQCLPRKSSRAVLPVGDSLKRCPILDSQRPAGSDALCW